MMRLINSIENMNDRMIEDSSNKKTKVKSKKDSIYTKNYNKKRKSMIQLIQKISEQYEIPLHFEKEEDIKISQEKDDEEIIIPITNRITNSSLSSSSEKKKSIIIKKETFNVASTNTTTTKSIIIDLSTNKPINSKNNNKSKSEDIFTPMKTVKRKANKINETDVYNKNKVDNNNNNKRKKVDNKENRTVVNKRKLDRLKNHITPK